MTRLTDEQIRHLLKPIRKERVKQVQGHSHIEAWDVRVYLNKIFGFAGWSLVDTSPAECVFERERKLSNNKDGFTVGYRAHLALVIHTPEGDATYAGSAIGEANGPNLGDVHDQALKSAESGALKRAAMNLGDQFGLSLYDNGSLKATVERVVGYTPPPTSPAEGDNKSAAPALAPPPVVGEQAPAPVDEPPSSAGAGKADPVQLRMLKQAIPGLDPDEKERLLVWCRERGIQNVLQPGDRVNDVLKRVEELVEARGTS
jgi:hypothetical protein